MFDNFGQFLTTSFLYFSLSFAGAIILLSIRNLIKFNWSGKAEIILLLIFQMVVLELSYLFRQLDLLVLFPFLISVSSLLITSKLFSGYSWVGRYFFVTNFLLLLFGLLWSFWFISSIPISPVTRGLMFLGAPLLIFSLPSGIIQFIEQFEVLCRQNWIRPRYPLPLVPRANFRKVSLQVPTYAEPPELVIETLNILSKIDYPDFEVIVIDNNTKDESLWRPVEKHCQKLGEKFQFFHIDPMAGAKAGALNFALTQTSSDVELIGVIDADYHANSDFLKALVGYFDDPNIGFVQTPHDYRDWEENAYLRMCYFEYQIFFHTTMVTLNEKDAALTVGTMCLIRKKALEKAGGWAEWCVTEDSELSIRIHAVGYSSVYLTQSFGKGLIPETFNGYKKQRFRWTAGPVQEFKHHFRLLMFWPWHKSSLLTFIQRVHHLNHGLDRFNVGLSLLLIPLGFAVVASMIIHKEIIQVPFELWLATTVLLVSSLYLNWLLYKVTLGCSLFDTLGALIASKALTHTISVASFRTIFQSQTPWFRTSKFKVTSRLLRALSTTKVELTLGVTIIFLVIVGFLLLPLPGLVLMFLIGMAYKGFDYLAAPFLAILAESRIKR
jgi:cellulose synthase/poly-beta-1,6-N-acetylglucosamine synthase-like glycosyltransferase